MHNRSILVFAGPNGSGKSTITGQSPLVGAYVNADQIEKTLKCDSLLAAKVATATREYLLSQEESFTFETVMSTPRNIELLRNARLQGYYITCIYVLTKHPEINVRRVKQRYASGGFNVPEEKVITRFHRAMLLIPELKEVCSRLLIYDNSAEKGEGEPALIAEIIDGIESIKPSVHWSENAIRNLLAGKYLAEPL